MTSEDRTHPVLAEYIDCEKERERLRTDNTKLHEQWANIPWRQMQLLWKENATREQRVTAYNRVWHWLVTNIPKETVE